MGLYGDVYLPGSSHLAIKNAPLYFFNGIVQSDRDTAALVFLGSAQALNASQQSQLAARGIQLLSISLDREEALFRETAGPYPWTHYCDLQGWDSPNVKAYRVFATPSFFLVNPDQTLEREFISTAQIETWLGL